MAETYSRAAVHRLRLRSELRKARLARGLTQKQVAEAMEWSPSKLIRIEAGEVGISVHDLRPLLHLYGIDEPVIEELLSLARTSRRMPFAEYRDIYGKEFLDFLAMEGVASVTRTFQPRVIPGLLQTEHYARATIEAYTPSAPSRGVLTRMVEARMLRQEILENEQAQFFFILDESVVRRHVGGPGVMCSQLLHLVDLVEGRPGLHIWILPFSAGAHVALAGSFTLFEFNEDMPYFVYLENPRGSATISTAPEMATGLLDVFWDLEACVIKDGSAEFLRTVADELGSSAA